MISHILSEAKFVSENRRVPNLNNKEDADEHDKNYRLCLQIVLVHQHDNVFKHQQDCQLVSCQKLGRNFPT